MRKTCAAMLVVMLICVLCLTACGKNKEKEAESESEELSGYAGVYYSGTIDGRALFLFEDGRYEWYSVLVGDSAQPTGDGIFKVRDGAINFGYTDDEGDFVIENQLVIGTDLIIEGAIDFNKLTSTVEPDLLKELTAMPVPMNMYLGEWENDTQFGWISLSETEYMIRFPDTYSSGGVIKGPDYLLIGMPDDLKRLTVKEDGGLEMEGTNGTYYPIGDNRLENLSHKAFIGEWSNETTGDQIQFSEEGKYAIASVGMNDDGTFYGGISSGGYDVREGILTYTYEETEHTAEIVDGVMCISDIEGFFEKN